MIFSKCLKRMIIGKYSRKINVGQEEVGEGRAHASKKKERKREVG